MGNLVPDGEVVHWRSASALVSINEVNLRRAGTGRASTWIGDLLRVQFPVRDIYLGM